jgi:hypothetical protein
VKSISLVRQTTLPNRFTDPAKHSAKECFPPLETGPPPFSVRIQCSDQLGPYPAFQKVYIPFLRRRCRLTSPLVACARVARKASHAAEPTADRPIAMPNRYADFYRALPPTTQQSVTSIYELLAPTGNRRLEWLVVALACPTEYHVMAYFGLDDKIHMIHCAAIVQPSLLYPNTCHRGRRPIRRHHHCSPSCRYAWGPIADSCRRPGSQHNYPVQCSGSGALCARAAWNACSRAR